MTLRHLSYLGTSLCIPSSSYVAAGYSIRILQVFIICEAFTNSFITENRKKSDGARSGLYGGCSKMSQWNCSCSRVCVCQAVCGRALSCNKTIPRKSLPLQQDNLLACRKQITPCTSQSAGFSIATAMATAISALTTRQGPTYNCMRQFQTSH